ncbi:hypothetical protein AB0B45_42165 [Nonomuraea sp. NPDC049152]|uniref:hypothetical protein n=1 Tax=Nonomuraea sp. NPDC049152 TaxID=3154350 RepID=UPI00340AACBB
MWDIEEFESAARVAVEELSRYVADSQSGAARVVNRTPPRELAERLHLANLMEKGGLTPEAFRGGRTAPGSGASATRQRRA